MFLLSWIQKKISWRKWVTKNVMQNYTMEVNGYRQLFGYEHSSNYLLKCSAEERNSYRIGTALQWVHDAVIIFIFGWTFPLSLLLFTFFLLNLSTPQSLDWAQNRDLNMNSNTSPLDSSQIKLSDQGYSFYSYMLTLQVINSLMFILLFLWRWRWYFNGTELRTPLSLNSIKEQLLTNMFAWCLCEQQNKAKFKYFRNKVTKRVVKLTQIPCSIFTVK